MNLLRILEESGTGLSVLLLAYASVTPLEAQSPATNALIDRVIAAYGETWPGGVGSCPPLGGHHADPCGGRGGWGCPNCGGPGPTQGPDSLSLPRRDPRSGQRAGLAGNFDPIASTCAGPHALLDGSAGCTRQPALDSSRDEVQGWDGSCARGEAGSGDCPGAGVGPASLPRAGLTSYRAGEVGGGNGTDDHSLPHGVFRFQGSRWSALPFS